MKSKYLFFVLLIFLFVLSACSEIEIVNYLDEAFDSVEANEEDIVDNESEMLSVSEMNGEEEVEDQIEVVLEEDLCDDYSSFFTYSPLAVENLEFIIPMGYMSDSHVTPVDHQYWNLVDFESEEESFQEFEIIAPADGRIIDLGYFTESISDSNRDDFESDYRFVIEHDCEIQSIFIHVDELSSNILEGVDFREGGSGYYFASSDVSVEGGEVIGTVSGRSFDFSVHDYNTELIGFVSPELYSGEPWKVHTVDPFDYFEESVRIRLFEKIIRNEDPLGGKIDYDVAGSLVGNWFKKGSNGYSGVDLDRYWDGHLTIAYNHYDPSLIMISIGDYLESSRQFAVKGNIPDPASVYVGDIVSYELIDYDYYLLDGSNWDRESYFGELVASGNENSIHGTVLFEVLEDEMLRMEVFDALEASQVSGFTDAALVYER